MKVQKRILIILFMLSVFFSIILGFFLFNSVFIEPNYFVCTNINKIDINIFSSTYEINYPKSCDQNEYFKGFQNFSSIIFNDHSYQQRPLYILLVYLANLFLYPLFSIINLESSFSLNLSVLFVHLIILNVALYLMLKLIKIDYISKYDLVLISFLNLIFPMSKWGIFEPSNQMFTLLLTVLPIYLAQKEFTHRNSLIFGFLFLAHRASFISFVIYLLIRSLKNKKINLNQNIKEFIIFLTPFIFYRLFFIFNKIKTYDTNTETFQQFTWIIDYFSGGNRKYGEYFCHRIPGFLKCYFEGTLDLIQYIFIPFFLVIVFLIFRIYKKYIDYDLILYTSVSSFVFYIFWSLIGWYPLRFIYYSLGNYINVIIIFAFFQMNKSRLSKFLYFLSISFYLLFLSMWNNPDSNMFIDKNYLLGSLIIVSVYFFFNFGNLITTNFKSYFKTS